MKPILSIAAIFLIFTGILVLAYINTIYSHDDIKKEQEQYLIKIENCKTSIFSVGFKGKVRGFGVPNSGVRSSSKIELELITSVNISEKNNSCIFIHYDRKNNKLFLDAQHTDISARSINTDKIHVGYYLEKEPNKNEVWVLDEYLNKLYSFTIFNGFEK